MKKENIDNMRTKKKYRKVKAGVRNYNQPLELLSEYSEPDTSVLQPMGTAAQTIKNDIYGPVPKPKVDFVKLFNNVAAGVTGAANLINNNKLKKQDRYNLIESSTPDFNYNTDEPNDMPMYRYGGGKKQTGGTIPLNKDYRHTTNRNRVHYDPLVTYPGDTLSLNQIPDASIRKLGSSTGLDNIIPVRTYQSSSFPYLTKRDLYKLADKDKKRVNDYISNLSEWQKFKFSMSGIPDSDLVAPAQTFVMPKDVKKKQAGGKGRNLNVEEGEMVETSNGEIMKVGDGEGTHEEGGVNLPGIKRVLEDTADKRKDKASKALFIAPDEMDELFGFRPKRKVTHAKALELAVEHYDKKRNKIQAAQKVLNSRPEIDKYASNTAKLNFKTGQEIPTKEDVFDALFLHQETVKDMNDIQDDGTIKKCGGKYNMKAQAGTGLKGSVSVGDSVPLGIHRRTARGVDRSKLYYDKDTDKWYPIGQGPQAYSPVAITNPLDNAKAPGDAGFTYLDPSKFKPSMNIIAGDVPAGDPALDGYVPEDNSGKPNTDVSINPRFVNQPDNKFYEPTYADELLPGLMELADSFGRTPELLNRVDYATPRYRRANPTEALNANQSDYNAALEGLESNNLGSGVKASNVANLQGQKYSANAKVMSAYDNQNVGIQNQEEAQRVQIKNNQAMINAKFADAYDAKNKDAEDIKWRKRMAAIQNITHIMQMKRRQNKSGNLVLKLSPAFDENGEYNGYQYVPTLPSSLGLNSDLPVIQTPKKKYKITTTENIGGKVIKREVKD